MFWVKKIEEPARCSSCGAKESEVKVSHGYDQSNTHSFSLCKNCRLDLIEKLGGKVSGM